MQIEQSKDLKSYKEISAELINPELAMIKYQLSPHFLFNSLNNIYSLVNKNDPKAKESILMLSNVMRYLINDCPEQKVHILKELEYISSYVELNKLRLNNPSCVKLNINVENTNAAVYPLLFIPFIENAFKHGDLLNNNLSIIFNFDILADKIVFTSYNSFKSQNKDIASGIAIKSTLNRLELLYSGQYDISISNDKTSYTVKLIIRL